TATDTVTSSITGTQKGILVTLLSVGEETDDPDAGVFDFAVEEAVAVLSDPVGTSDPARLDEAFCRIAPEVTGMSLEQEAALGILAAAGLYSGGFSFASGPVAERRRSLVPRVIRA